MKKRLTLYVDNASATKNKIDDTPDSEIAEVMITLAHLAVKLGKERGENVTLEQAAYYLTCQRSL